ncbi:MAG: thiamine biosynthesis lipoprotein [Flavobacteriales bacterium]|jgi:thiamine biosynthesis lipoprotein
MALILGRNTKGLVLLALFCVAILPSCHSESDYFEFTGPTMGTRYSIKVLVDDAGDKAEYQKLSAQITQTLRDFNQSMSTYIADSELSRFNKSSVGEWFNVSKSLCFVLAEAESISQLSSGAFDVTVGPLVNAWGFGPDRHENPPSDADLTALLTLTGFQSLDINCDSLLVRKSKAVYVDLSAIAKGYATDVIADILLEKSYQNFMVEIGGELNIRGVNPGGVPWRIAIEKPSLFQGASSQVLSIPNKAVATSGDYRNYYEKDGQFFSHTINPATARPVNHALASVTVVADTGARADAYATALNVLGPDAGFALAKHNKLAAFFIVRGEEGFEFKFTDQFVQYKVKP